MQENTTSGESEGVMDDKSKDENDVEIIRVQNANKEDDKGGPMKSHKCPTTMDMRTFSQSRTERWKWKGRKSIRIVTDFEAPSTQTVLTEDNNVSTAIVICKDLVNFKFFN